MRWEINIKKKLRKSSKEKLTSQGGAILFGEFLSKAGFVSAIRQHMSLPKNHRGYEAEKYIIPLIMMLHIGGKYIEDIRLIQRDRVMREILGLTIIPSVSSMGDWLRKIGNGIGIE